MLMRKASIIAITLFLISMLGTAAKGEESPIILHPTGDTWIMKAHPTGIYGLKDSMAVANPGMDPAGSSTSHSLVKFDLSSIPSGALIASAKLFLYHHYCGVNDPCCHCRFSYLSAYKITIDWVEDAVSWDDIWWETEPPATDEVQLSNCLGWIDWDVTTDVQSFVNGEKSNYGWMIKDHSGATSHPPGIWFRTKESGDHIPFLEIVLESEEWPMFHHDASNRGINNSKTLETNDLLWKYTMYGSSVSPAVYDDKVYTAGHGWGPGSDAWIHCLDVIGNGDGSTDPVWTYEKQNGYTNSSPAVAYGKVYIGVSTEVLCLNAEGNGDGTTDLEWSYAAGGAFNSSPAVVDGRVYIGSADYNIYCLDAEGNGGGSTDLIWSYTTGDEVNSSPAVFDGKVYVGSADNNVYCLDAEGNGGGTTALIWSYTTGHVAHSPALADGKVFVGSADGNLYCLDAAGNGDGTTDLIWSYTTGGEVSSTPCIANGRVYFGSNDNNIYCLDAAGICNVTPIFIWSYATGNDVRSSPAVVDGKVYVGSADSKMYCLDAAGNGNGTTNLIWNYTAYNTLYSSPAVARGSIYITCMSTYFYCFRGVFEPDPIQSSVEPWDTYGQAFVCPGTGTSCDSITVTVLDENGDPCPYCQVEIDLSGCSGLCIDSPDDLSGTTDRNGVVRLNPRVGGCSDCSIIVRAQDTEISTYSKITSADWDGNWADGKVELVDSLYFMSQFMQPLPEPCADYDASGAVDLVDLAMLACCMGSTNDVTCSLFYDCAVVPGSLDFDTILTGTTLDTTLFIINTGSASLCDTVSLSCDHFSLVSGGGLYYIPSGDSLLVTVQFAPADTGIHVCTIETGDLNCGDVQCTGVAIKPCAVFPVNIDFGVVYADCFLDTTFTIINNQELALLGSVSESCPYYSITAGGGPYTLAAGEILTVKVHYEPRYPGTHPCVIETGNSFCCDVLLAGSTPYYTSTDQLDFEEVEIGLTEDLSFTINNHGCSETLAGMVDELFTYDDFSIVSGAGPFQLDPGESKRVTVRFQPSSNISLACIIDTGNEHIRNIGCCGTGKYVPAGGKERILTSFFLEPSDPNPFNPVTRISYNLPRDAMVRLTIYNINGQRIASLVNEYQSAGFKTVFWDGKDDSKIDVSSGVYFCRFEAGGYSETRKMVLLR